VDCVSNDGRKSGQIVVTEQWTDNDRAVTPLVGNYGLIIKRDDRQQAEQNRQRCRAKRRERSGEDRVATGTEGRMICWAPAGWSLRQQQQHQQQMKQQSMDGRAYCGKHALIGSERAGCGPLGFCCCCCCC